MKQPCSFRHLATLPVMAMVLLFTVHEAVSQPSCCAAGPTARFAMLGTDPSFRGSHESPLPFHFVPEAGSMISIPVPGGKPARAFEVKAAEPTHNYLLVIHEWWGLNDYIQQAAERYARELGNVHVIAIDLYDGKVTADPAEAAKIMGGVKEDRIRAILRAALGYAGPTARIQTLGWCFGGGWSLQAAIMAGSRGTGCVMYYGMPETDATKLKELKAPVLGLFASKDDWITPEIVSDFVRTMKKNGKDIRVNSYTAAHAFANPSNPKYNKEAADAANQLALKFLREHLH